MAQELELAIYEIWFAPTEGLNLILTNAAFPSHFLWAFHRPCNSGSKTTAQSQPSLERMGFEEFRSRPRALCEYEGQITSILLVNGSTYTDSNSDQRIGETPRPFLESFCLGRNPEEKLHFVIFAESDRDVSPDAAPKMAKPSLEQIWSKFQIGPDDPQIMLGNRSAPQEKFLFTFQVVREDIAIERIVNETIRHAGIKLSEQPDSLDIFHLSAYVRDRFVVLRTDPGQISLLESYYLWPTDERHHPSQDHFVSRYIADVLSANISNISMRSSPLFFEGGDMLIGKDFALIGYRTLKQNLLSHKSNPNLDTPEKVLCAFVETLGVPSVYCLNFFGFPVGYDDVPSALYHLDLYLTLLGERAGMVMAAVGEIMVWDGCAWERAPNDDPEQVFLDHFEYLLENGLPNGQRFIVKRLPLLRHAGKHLSYNNCLVESHDGGRIRVYLPTFENGAPQGFEAALREADEKTISRLNQWRIEVSPVRYNFHTWAASAAGLHCITQVLTRSTG